MSGSQKALKVISIVMIVYAVLMIAFGAFMAAGSSFLAGSTIDVSGTAADAQMMASVMGVSIIVGAVVNLIIGFLGLRGAKDPRKIGPFFVLCVIGLVLGLVGLGMSIAQGSFQPTSLISIVIVAVCLYLASKVKKQI